MTPEEIQCQVDRISWGNQYISVRDGFGKEHTLILVSMNLADKNWANFIYKRTLDQAEENGLMSEFDLKTYYSKVGLWTTYHEEQIEGLTSDIKKLNDGIKEQEGFNKKVINKLTRLKFAATKALRKLQSRKVELFSVSAEQSAAQQKVGAVIFCSTYRLDNSRLWNSWEDFQEERDRVLIDNITKEFGRSTKLETSDVREIARSAIWRNKWLAAKNVGKLFDKPIVELSQEQESLIYWSQVYDAAYEAYDRPSDSIIQDDDALDQWFEDQAKERRRKQVYGGKGRKKKGIISDKVAQHSEIMVVANHNINPEAPSPGEVWDLNSDGNKRFISHQNKMIKESVTINEKDLRASRDMRMLSGAKRAEFKIGRGGKKIITKEQDY